MTKTLLKQSLDLSEKLGGWIIYRIEAIKGKPDDVSVYIPKSAFANPAGPYPESVTITVEIEAKAV